MSKSIYQPALLGMLMVALLMVAAPLYATCDPSNGGTPGNDVIICDATHLPGAPDVAGNLGDDVITINPGDIPSWVAGDMIIPVGGGQLMPLGTGGADTITINSGAIAGTVLGDYVTGNGGNDTIIVKGRVQYAVYGDWVQLGNGGNDHIEINGYVSSIFGDVVQGGRGGNDTIIVRGTVADYILADDADGGDGDDYVELHDGAVVNGLIDGQGGTDTLAFVFSFPDEASTNAFLDQLDSLSPGSGTLTINNTTFTWQNFEDFKTILNTAPPEIFPSDGRINKFGAEGAVYTPEGGGIQVYGIDANSHGYLAAYVSPNELANLTCPPTENRLLAESADGKFAIYQLTTCEYQVNIGPDEDGKVQVTIFTGIPATNITNTEFFLNR